jgi:hypothetical protein
LALRDEDIASLKVCFVIWEQLMLIGFSPCAGIVWFPFMIESFPVKTGQQTLPTGIP